MAGRVMKTNCLRIVCVQSGILVDNVKRPSDLKLVWYVGLPDNFENKSKQTKTFYIL